MNITTQPTQENELLQEKRKLKEAFSSSFLYDLDVIIEKFFLAPKKKKEHFITMEKLQVELIRLLQTQKKFTSLKDVKEDLKSLAVFDIEENIIGRIIKIDPFYQTVEFEDMNLNIKHKSFSDVTFFDFCSIQCISVFDKQKQVCDMFTYRDVYKFLLQERKKNENPKKTVAYSINSIVPVRVKVSEFD
jgi:hypothetical protein